jgi:DNA-binding transcriptional ArsR family regulator
VWRKLHVDNQTSWEHWLEPFEQSEGLMLEYVHVLTQGRRLQAVIDDQIRQRQQEERHDELAIIRSTAVICAFGAEVQVSKLCELLAMKPENASRALSRLLDEHLVRESRPGVLGGLHLLRSQALNRAAHDEAVFLSADSFWQSLPIVTNDSMPRAVQSLLTEANEEDETTALNRLAKILSDSSDIETWVAILTGLGLATVERQVASFMQILEGHGVQRAQWSLASMFSDPGIDIPELREFEHWQNLRDAVLAFRALPKADLRPACLKHLPKDGTVPSCQNVQQANKLLSCLAPICGGEPVPLTISPNLVSDENQNIRQVAALLSTAHLIGSDVAENLVQALGGEQVLFDRFRAQTPWVTTPAIDPNGSHGRTVRSDWYLVAEQEQPDPHETVCSICETLIAISPESDAAASDAVNPHRQPISAGGFTPWSKNMPRHNIPAKARVAWNVAFRQILLARSAADSLTDYTRQMAGLIKRTEKVFRSFTEKWIKDKSIANADKLADEINEIIAAVNALAYATPEKPSSEMTAPTQGASNDDTLGALLTGVLGNLIRRISQLQTEGGRKGMATFAGSLSAQAEEHKKSPIWRTNLDPPLHELDAMRERLSAIASILHQMAHDDGPSLIQGIIKVARKSQLNKGVGAAARHCRLLSDQRFNKTLRRLEATLKDKGWSAQCYSRPISEADSVYWPAKEVAILVEITDFEKDAAYIEDTLSLGQQHLGTDWRFRIVPVLNGYVLPALALLPSSHIALPDLDFEKDWCEHIDRPLLSPEILGRFDKALAACTQLSAILTCRDPENLHPDEERVFLKCFESFERNRDFVADAADKTSSEHLVWACTYLNENWDQVVCEFEAVRSGQPVATPLCMITHQTLAGQVGDQSMELAGARILILQAECMNAVDNDHVSLTGAA